MPWWGWILAGALLLAAEMGIVSADFYLVFLGVAALAVGLLGLAGLAGPVWFQWLLFAVLGVGSLVGFRGRVYERVHGNRRSLPEGVVGDTAVAGEAIAAGAIGSVELRGARWSARNEGPAVIEPGARVRVEGTEGVLLRVRGEAREG